MEMIRLNRKRGIPRRLQAQRGYGTTDMLIGFVLFLFAVGGSYVLYIMAKGDSDLSREQQNLSAIRTHVQQTFSGQPDYSGLDNALALAAGTFPSSMKKSGGVVNAWGGAVTVAEDADPSRFTITYAGVPQEACVKLSVFGFGTWYAVDVNGNDIPQTGSGSVGAAAGVCTDASTITYTSN